MHDIEIKNMIRMANDARDRAYAPYSEYKVGACLKGESGAFYLGCNVECASYSPTNCAERTAVFQGYLGVRTRLYGYRHHLQRRDAAHALRRLPPGAGGVLQAGHGDHCRQ